MAQYMINADGSTKVFSRYDTAGVLTLNAIFPPGIETAKKYIKRKKGVKCALQHKYGLHDNTALVRLVFTKLLMKILTRVADGDLFNFPGRTGAYITLKPIQADRAKAARQKGRYADYDIVKANFKIPRFCVDFGPRASGYDFQVYVPKELNARALKNAENGLIPWAIKPKECRYDIRRD